MKKLIHVSALLCALLLLLSLGVSADGENWSEEYYRVIDYTDSLSDAQVESLDEDCIAILSDYKVDLAFLVLTQEDQGSDSLEAWARDAYDACSFGYGSNRDGFMAVYNADTEEIALVCFGSAAARMEGMNYSTLMGALAKAGIEINRKVLADLAMNNYDAFKAIVAKVK